MLHYTCKSKLFDAPRQMLVKGAKPGYKLSLRFFYWRNFEILLLNIKLCKTLLTYCKVVSDNSEN